MTWKSNLKVCRKVPAVSNLNGRFCLVVDGIVDTLPYQREFEKMAVNEIG
jgi:hypothetical protein